MLLPSTRSEPTPRELRRNLFIIAYRYFPTRLLTTAVGVALLSGPLLYGLFRDVGVGSIAIRVLLAGVVVAVVPTLLLYLVTLLRATVIRRRLEGDSRQLRETLEAERMVFLQKTFDERKEMQRLEHAVEVDLQARKERHEKEDERWDSLNERLQEQEDTGQQNVDDRAERDLARKAAVSDSLEARYRMDDARWEHLRTQLLALEQREIARERQQAVRDQELAAVRRDDRLREHYHTLFSRYLRQSKADHCADAVADGHSAIPRSWLASQPEVIKDPTLPVELETLSTR